MNVTSTWIVTGMHCGGCAKRVRKHLQEKVPSFVDAQIDPKTGVVNLVTDVAPDEAGIREAVTTAGYNLVGPKA